MKRVLLAASLALASFGAASHQAPSGWDYSEDCCYSVDCAPVPDTAIEEVQGGYSVNIPRGTHPMLMKGLGTEPARKFFPHGDGRIRPSGDEKKHACVRPSGTVLCIYITPSGV